MIITEKIRINAPLSVVWEVFSDIGQWREWNPVCRECRFEQGRTFTRGSCISFELNPIFFPIRIAPVVETCNPGKKVIWTGSKWGISARHTFEFNQRKTMVTVKSTEVFNGILLLPARLAGVTGRLHQLTIRLLQAIKTESEARAHRG